MLPFELSGPVYVVLEAGQPLPKLGVFLRGGGFEIVLIATNGFQGIRILNIFGAVPDAAAVLLRAQHQCGRERRADRAR